MSARSNTASDMAKEFFTTRITAITMAIGKTTRCMAEVHCMTVRINYFMRVAGIWIIFMAKG